MSVTSLKKRSKTGLSSRKETPSKKTTEIGALASTFPCSESKILDHIVAMKDFDYSISDISKISGVGFKTTLGVVHKLEGQGVLKRTRQIGNAILYKLNSDSAQARSISKLAFEIAKRRIRESSN